MGKRTGSGRDPDPISEKKGTDVDVVSHLDEPIESLAEVERALLFAELSYLSYLPDAEAQPVFTAMGFTSVKYLEESGAQAYELGTDTDLAVVCRGTEPNEWNDLRADANAFPSPAWTSGPREESVWTAIRRTGVGLVHSGFKREVDDLWPRIEATLADEHRTIWFCGHSLGGAMATICAGRCEASETTADARAVYTYGSPRVGNGRYIQRANVAHIRWVNNNDIVTRVPPRWLGYRHTGTEHYLDRNGNHRRMTRVQRAKDRSVAFRAGLRERKFDHFSDHAMREYLKHLRRAAEQHARRGF